MVYDDPDEEWTEEDENEDDVLLVCPSCRQAVHEDTQQCPYCGDWIVPEYPSDPRKRFLWVVAAMLVILALILITVF